MYYFITKSEYFETLEVKEIEAALSGTQDIGLKHIQDACMLYKLRELAPGVVAEIGGGVSRTLPFLLEKGWSCWNIEPFEGVGNGPRSARDMPGITYAKTYLGVFDSSLPDAFFDCIYSISVLEHVPTSDLDSFFQDMFRIVAAGGQAWHAIDVYLGDKEDAKTAERIAAVYNAAIAAGFATFSQHDTRLPPAVFLCKYATNPDLVMRQWNRLVPSLKAKRAICQSTSLLLGLVKSPAIA